MSDSGVKYWLHRVSHEWDVSYKLLNEGYLTIGWAMLAGSNILSCMGERVDTELFESIMKEHGLQSERSRWSLWYFFSFNPGDIVLVPLYSGEFSLYRVVEKAIKISNVPGYSDFLSESGERITRDTAGLLMREDSDTTVDLGFALRVEPIKEHLSRYEYADNKLTSRMKIRQTNSDISDLADSINSVLKADAPINLYATIIDELSNKVLDAITTQLTPDKFELLVKWYFQKLGASKAYIPAKNESGKWDGADADIIAEYDPLKIVFYVQVKLHDDVTSQWAVEQISKYKVQHEQAVADFTIIPWVITSATSFSPDAVSMAQDNNVRLITGTEFARMLIDAGITDINKAFE